MMNHGHAKHCAVCKTHANPETQTISSKATWRLEVLKDTKRTLDDKMIIKLKDKK